MVLEESYYQYLTNGTMVERQASVLERHKDGSLNRTRVLQCAACSKQSLLALLLAGWNESKRAVQ
jgi:hypothetical protein